MNRSYPTRSRWHVKRSGVENLERLMYATSRAHRREAGRPERMEGAHALSDREHIIGACTDHVVSEEHPAEDESAMHAWRRENMSQARVCDSIADIVPLVEGSKIASVPQEGCNRISRTDNWLEGMPWDFVEMTINDKLWPVEFENHLLRTNEDVTLSSGHFTSMTGAVLHSQDSTALPRTVVKKETDKAVYGKEK